MQALAIKNTDIVAELSLPPVKIHCSVLAEDAIKAAIADYKKKQDEQKPATAGTARPADGVVVSACPPQRTGNCPDVRSVGLRQTRCQSG